ncbi:class A beta-lactamase-related serine hydrolase [Algoriphagus halophytocola]|uniref:serine hydrolase n=1 Tax=Algoriphagus halophytocola TaxID=2991499 RepID=UPI0022DDBDE4|nr:serine hydrolase [Algoriphagus sp. TR-M9]WBL41611.1 class A beta-lactamase-related serine hydrolase [Algoriphagus sp. TR-M9]
MKYCHLLLSLFLIILTSKVTAQNQDKLSGQIKSLIKDFKGDIGIYMEHIPSGNTIEINADTIFPTASLVKVPILLGIFDKIENGELQYHQPLMYRDSIKYGGSGLMQFFRDSTQTDLSTLIALMLSYSDNTTSLWNQALAGGGSEINLLMEKLGYQHTRVNSRTAGREKIWEKYGWGQSTPKEMAGMFKQIFKKEMISIPASEQMYRLLSNTFYTDYAISSIPPGVNVASKQGMVNASRSEVFLVNAPEGDYVCAIFTKNNKDQSWEYNNEAWELTRAISSLFWNQLNPNHPYQAPVQMKQYQEGLAY